MFEEPTVAEEEREAMARENMAKAVAELVAGALWVSAVLVVARGPGLPSGVLLGDHDRRQGHELDPVILAEILTNAHDDRVVHALSKLLLGDDHPIEHTVARNAAGEIMGVIAIRTRGRVSSTWMRTVLARAGKSLSGWLEIEPTWSWPPQALIEAIEEPALAHEGGLVIVANHALARLFGREPNDIVGTSVKRITQRVPPIRTCSLVVGGRPRTALIFGSGMPRLESTLCDAVDSVLGEQYAFVRQTTRVSFDRREDVSALVAPPAIHELLRIALLDMTTVFANVTPANQLRISIYREEPWAMVELVATGSIAPGPDVEHLGSVICSSRTRAVGGQFLTDTSRPDARVVRISLPVES